MQGDRAVAVWWQFDDMTARPANRGAQPSAAPAGASTAGRMHDATLNSGNGGLG